MDFKNAVKVLIISGVHVPDSILSIMPAIGTGVTGVGAALGVSCCGALCGATDRCAAGIAVLNIDAASVWAIMFCGFAGTAIQDEGYDKAFKRCYETYHRRSAGHFRLKLCCHCRCLQWIKMCVANRDKSTHR